MFSQSARADQKTTIIASTRTSCTASYPWRRAFESFSTRLATRSQSIVRSAVITSVVTVLSYRLCGERGDSCSESYRQDKTRCRWHVSHNRYHINTSEPKTSPAKFVRTCACACPHAFAGVYARACTDARNLFFFGLFFKKNVMHLASACQNTSLYFDLMPAPLKEVSAHCMPHLTQCGRQPLPRHSTAARQPSQCHQPLQQVVPLLVR